MTFYRRKEDKNNEMHLRLQRSTRLRNRDHRRQISRNRQDFTERSSYVKEIRNKA